MRNFAVLTFITFISATGFAQQPAAEKNYASAIVMEPTSKRVLFADNADQPLPVASMTKMMTLLIAREMINEGTVSFDTPITVSARASLMGGSQVYLKHNEVFPLRDMMAATMVHSANDGAMAIAERLGGTPDSFVNMMNERAQRLGMKNSKFYSPHGLPAEKGMLDDVMSAHDAAIIGIELMKYPEMREWARTQQMPFRGGLMLMDNPNRLLKIYPEATGIKTGFHNKAGFCITASAKRGDMELVAVVMGTPLSRKRANFETAAGLMSEAFANYRLLQPVKKGVRLAHPASIQGGQLAGVPVYAGDSTPVLLKRSEAQKLLIELHSSRAQAPIKKGQQVGTIFVKNGQTVVAKVPALAAVDVEAESWWKRFSPF